MTIIDRTAIAARVIHLAAEQVTADPAEVSDITHFKQDLNYDSLDDVEFVMTCEDEFDIRIGDAAAERVKTVGDAVNEVIEQLSTRAST